MKKKYYTFLLMLGVQNNSLLIIVITLIGTWRENKITLSDSNLQRKLVFLNNEKAAFQSVFFSMELVQKSCCYILPFSSVCKRLGEIFFHTYSQACSIPFVLCEISTKGLESRLEKSAAASP